MSNSLDLDQDRHSVSSDLGPNCLQSLSADYKSLKESMFWLRNEKINFNLEALKVLYSTHLSR